jgi:hypothetical protein
MEWAEELGSRGPEGEPTYSVVLVDLVHATIALVNGDDLARVLHDDLVGLEAAIRADAVASIRCLDHLDADAVLAALGLALREVGEGAVRAVFFADVAVALVAFVEHNPVLAVFGAAVLLGAYALGEIAQVRRLLPVEQ